MKALSGKDEAICEHDPEMLLSSQVQSFNGLRQSRKLFCVQTTTKEERDYLTRQQSSVLKPAW